MNSSFSTRSSVKPSAPEMDNISPFEDQQPLEVEEKKEKDSRFFNIGALPSKYAPYKFKELLIRPFNFNDLKLISRAAQTKTIKNIVHAVDNCINEDAFNLTVGDFYYVMFWLRVNSYPKTPWSVSWVCRNIVKDEEKNEEKICGHENMARIMTSSIQILTLDKPDLEPGLDFPRAKHLDDIQDMMEEPELRQLIRAIQWIAGDTMKEKLLILESSEDLELYENALDASFNCQHGIIETLNLRCKECGGLYSHKMTINPLTFFR